MIHCEVLTGGNPALLDQEPYAERRDSRIDYSKIFGDQSSQQAESGATPAKRARPASGSAKKPKANVTPAKQEAKTSGTPAKAVGGAIKTPKSGKKSGEPKTPKTVAVKKESAKKTNTPAVRTAVSSPSVARPAGSQKLSDHKVRILAAPATPYHIDRTPQGGGGGGGRSDGADKKSAAGYTCHTCGFTATRLNVIVLHSKTHSAPPASNNSSRSNFASATPPKSSPGGAKKPEKERPFRDDRVTSTSKPRKRDGKGAAAAASKAERTARGATAAGGPAVKKGRLTKKQREEKREQEERREAERRRLLGDWSEDEHQEEEEYKKLQVSCSTPFHPFPDPGTWI